MDTKENINSNNNKPVKAAAKDNKGLKERKPDYDPILDDPVSGESNDEDSGSSSGAESDEQGGLEIDFPRENAVELLTFLHRDITNLQNMDDSQKRKFALIHLYQVFVLAKNKAPGKVYQEILPEIQKLLFKRLTDKVEKSRELAALIIKEFFTRCDDLTPSVPYLLPVLVDRLNAENLEGLDNLPERMQPVANQKALMMVDPPEKSEEVRVVLAEIVTIIVSTTLYDCLRPYTQTIIDICRALCMDPAGSVLIAGCQAMKEFAINGEQQLLHFCENMGRALFTSFVHKHAKVRMAGLNALFDVCVCGQWKYSVNIFEHMIGFRDPNVVPIKDFYETSTKINYLALFVADRSTAVRDCFYKTIGDLLSRLPDKVDHEGRLFPYLISGLYDANDEIRSVCFEIIEEMGALHEEMEEVKLREIKQLGFQSEWTQGGTIKDSMLILPFPILRRPRLGARIQVRQYVRRYIKALFKEIGDWIQENKERASNLLLYSVVYVEDFMTQFLDNALVALYKSVLEKENKTVSKNIRESLKLIGRYCVPDSFRELIISAIKNELASFYPYTQSGAIKSFGYLFTGTVELLSESSQFSKVEVLLSDFVHTVNNYVLEGLDMDQADILLGTLQEVVNSLLAKQEKDIDIKYVIVPHLHDMLMMTLRIMAVFQNFKIVGKPDPPHVALSKKEIPELIQKLSQLSETPEENFLTKQLPEIVIAEFVQKRPEQIKVWALQNANWRFLYAVFELLDQERLQLQLPEYELKEEEPMPIKRVKAATTTDEVQKALPMITEEKDGEEEEEVETIDTSAAPQMTPQMQSQTEAPAAEQAPEEEEKKDEEAEKKKKKEEPEEPLDFENSKTVFDEICRLVTCVMGNNVADGGANKNLKAKRLAVFQLFPKLVNLTVPFITADHSSKLLKIMKRAMVINWGTRDANESMLMPLINLNKDFLKTGGVVLDDVEQISAFEKVVLIMKKTYQFPNEQVKREGCKVCKDYLTQFAEQIVQKCPEQQKKMMTLCKTTFMATLAEELLPLLSDYFDSVRDVVCSIFELLVNQFLPFAPDFTADQQQLVQVLRANLSGGWSKEMTMPLRDMALMESDLIKYLFKDAVATFKQLVTVMMDEASTREPIGRVLLKMNKSMPFLLLNDYRVSHATNSLQRLEVLKDFIKVAQQQENAAGAN